MPNHQYSLALITHQVQNSTVEQRAEDGYINATAMCKAAGKLFGHYQENASTKAYLEALEADIGIPISKLIQVLRGANVAQGTWIHPQVAIHLAQWLSPQFAVQVSKWVFDWMSGKGSPAKLPYHLERHLLNQNRIPLGYFSVLQEMTNFLVGPMEANGYRLPEKCMPDISHAKLLCKHLRDDHGVDTTALAKYSHEFPDGRVVQANLYPVEYLGAFRQLMAEVWMPQHAAAYFKTRDPAALPALDKILLLSQAQPPKKVSANKSNFQRKA
ncbi:KilA-N domain-containing protein [Acidovorax sp. CCYZU-2555]|uniref:KilA-N domain-containing protein n=1 Tax=Acidovorax sp. CCYZU-2555 TaxID=2835042 RepID=UPI001BCF11D1|nr:KilA-N domain-containing protein [Acidovorax sp. CCYZU-2555]MBS7778512.1 KilA-N domain-containing protein [Acidovorax sp. CCYZU-2555]